MAAASGGGSSSAVSSLPPPSPKSPPEWPDLCGKRRGMAKIQMLEREIGFLQEELKLIEGLQPASRSCREIADFVLEKPDPLMPATHRKNQKTSGFWNWLCGMSCFNSSCICCSFHSECSCHLKCPACCQCGPCGCNSCLSCQRRCIRCSTCTRSCCGNAPSGGSCCIFPSCGNCLCYGCKCSSPKCPKVHLCCNCKNLCCNFCLL